MATFFERLAKFNRLYDNNAPVYLRSHPLTTDRLADIENRLVSVPYKQIPDSLDFQMVRAKLRAYGERPEEAIVRLEEGLQQRKFNDEVAQRFGLIHALLRAKQYARAEREMQILRKVAPSHPMIENLAADLKRAQGQSEQALGIYRAALKSFPFHRALMYGYAETLMNVGQNAEAVRFLELQLKQYPSDDRLYEYQARGYASLNKEFLSHQALAEAYVHRGNLSSAIEQLQIALKTREGDFYQLSSAEARLKQLKTLDADSRKDK